MKSPIPANRKGTENGVKKPSSEAISVLNAAKASRKIENTSLAQRTDFTPHSGRPISKYESESLLSGSLDAAGILSGVTLS